MIYIASDHGGYEMKKGLIEYLRAKNLEVADMGPYKLVPEDDYPDYAIPLVKKVLESPDKNKGILICRNGVGVSILANKVRGIRAGLSWTPEHAASARKDDNTNILSLPADYIKQSTAEEITHTWLNTEFSLENRHKRRLEVIKVFESSR